MGDVFRVFSQDKVLQRLVEQIIVDFSGLDRVHSALRGAEPSGVSLVVPSSDVIVFRTASLGTRTLFLRTRCCDTLPTCFATAYGDFYKIFENFYVKVDTDPEVDSPVALDFTSPFFLTVTCPGLVSGCF